MKVALLCLVSFLLLRSTTGYGQVFEPVEVAKQIFGKTTYTTSKRYATGEYEGHPNGHDLPPTATTHFLLLGQDDKRAVVAMTIQGEASQTADTYLHFQKDTIWKICAFRALAMTGIIARAKQELEQMTPAQIDALIARESAEKDTDKGGAFRSRADYDFALGNSSLILESDNHLIAHFQKHKTEFERIRDLALAEAPRAGLNEMGDSPVGSAEKAAYRKLFISSLHAEHVTSGKRLNFVIGGISDNTVGYFYITDKQAVPAMTPDNIIMVREIGDGWYLYKTT